MKLRDDVSDQGRCDIDLLYCLPGKEAILQRYVDRSRPMLLRGFLHGTPDCTAKKKKHRKGAAGWPWRALKRWQRVPLLEKHGAVTVPARRSSEAANEYGHAHFGRYKGHPGIGRTEFVLHAVSSQIARGILP